MKKIIVITLNLMLCLQLLAQKQTITWQDTQREYIIHVPSSWDSTSPRPMMYVLHGLGVDISQLDAELNPSFYSNLSGWIIVLPQALNASVDALGQHVDIGTMWNAGLTFEVFNQTFAPNSEVDDEGFLLALMDSINLQYPIDYDSIYIVGGSMGGFMTNVMGIKYSDKLAGIAPISGPIPNNVVDSLANTHLDVLYFHGTNDAVISYEDGSTDAIPYIGNVSLGLGAEQTVSWWVKANACDSVPVVDSLEDRCEDGLNFVRYKYSNSEDSTKVQFIKAIGGEHTWYMGANIFDIDYTLEIYNFFAGKNIPYPNVSSINNTEDYSFAFYPNPTKDNITLSVKEDCNMWIVNTFGQKLKYRQLHKGNTKVDVSDLRSGYYIVVFENNNNTTTQKLIIK